MVVIVLGKSVGITTLNIVLALVLTPFSKAVKKLAAVISIVWLGMKFGLHFLQALSLLHLSNPIAFQGQKVDGNESGAVQIKLKRTYRFVAVEHWYCDCSSSYVWQWRFQPLCLILTGSTWTDVEDSTGHWMQCINRSVVWKSAEHTIFIR